MTPDEEIKIRDVWGDYVSVIGWPTFRDGVFDMPVQRTVSHIIGDAEMTAPPVVDKYTFKRSIRERTHTYENIRALEETIECQGVIVHREWVKRR